MSVVSGWCAVSAMSVLVFFCFFFQAEDGIRDTSVTGVQTCALPIYAGLYPATALARERDHGDAPARQTEPRAHAGAFHFPLHHLHRGGLLQRVARRETIRRHQLHT